MENVEFLLRSLGGEVSAIIKNIEQQTAMLILTADLDEEKFRYFNECNATRKRVYFENEYTCTVEFCDKKYVVRIFDKDQQQQIFFGSQDMYKTATSPTGVKRLLRYVKERLDFCSITKEEN